MHHASQPTCRRPHSMLDCCWSSPFHLDCSASGTWRYSWSNSRQRGRRPGDHGLAVRFRVPNRSCPDVISTCRVSSDELATTPRGCSVDPNSVIFEGMKPRPPVPTLEQLRRGHPWCWVVCERCLHRRPVAFVPLIIRWGPDASSNLIRRSARCTVCGGKGATLHHPSWAGMDLGWEPFPASS